MFDVLMVALLLAAFGGLAGFVHACAALTGRGDTANGGRQ